MVMHMVLTVTIINILLYHCKIPVLLLFVNVFISADLETTVC